MKGKGTRVGEEGRKMGGSIGKVEHRLSEIAGSASDPNIRPSIHPVTCIWVTVKSRSNDSTSASQHNTQHNTVGLVVHIFEQLFHIFEQCYAFTLVDYKFKQDVQ